MDPYIPITQPGVYLYRAPQNLKFNIFREMVVVLAVPSKEACGIVFYHPESNPKELFSELELLRMKLKTELKVGANEIQAKVFGGALSGAHLIKELKEWAEDTKIKIVATDTGRNVLRTLRLHCDTGKVGVSYAARSVDNPLQFVSTGTARLRNPMTQIHTEVLILSHKAVKRTLAKQAIEEQAAWSASIPADPTLILKNKTPKEFPWSVVLIFDDLKDLDGLANWVKNISAKYSAVQFRWVGPELPSLTKEFPELRLLPPIEPELIRDFKAMLQQAVFEHLTHSTSDVLKFPKKRKAR